jgi:hypothetical protein
MFTMIRDYVTMYNSHCSFILDMLALLRLVEVEGIVGMILDIVRLQGINGLMS